MKISELTGALLDYWVAQAEGYKLDEDGDNRTIREGGAPSPWQPSTDWAHGGPIIERELIEITGIEKGRWIATPNIPPMPSTDGGHDHIQAQGTTPLVAAMRAYVASKFGDDVPEDVAQ